MNDLNDLLHNWAPRQEPSSVELRIQHEQILKRLVNVAEATSVAPIVAVRRETSASNSSMLNCVAVVAVAASLLLATSMFWFGHPGRLTNSRESELVSVPAGDPTSGQPLFSELNRMFEGHWRWLSEVNGNVHLEVDESTDDGAAIGHNETNAGVSVRLTVMQRRTNDAKWTVVWDALVLTRSEEWVRLPIESTGDNAVSIWAYSMPDGSTLIESDVVLTVPIPVRLSEQHVFGTSHGPARLWSARRSEGEFQIIQSVARMEAHHG
ncbi:MAG: hypothetical protein NT013_23685 [Planctomycetia bacterium]|nr:hypothetical protein [Planctomycetia bacterium]